MPGQALYVCERGEGPSVLLIHGLATGDMSGALRRFWRPSSGWSCPIFLGMAAAGRPPAR